MTGLWAAQEEGGGGREGMDDPSNGLSAWLAQLMRALPAMVWHGAAPLGPWPVAVAASCSEAAAVAPELRAAAVLDHDIQLHPPGAPLAPPELPGFVVRI